MTKPHLLSLAAGVTLAVGAGSAAAIVVDGAEIGTVVSSFLWSSNTAKYQDYAQGCGTTGCGTAGNPSFSANDDILFFWGTYDDSAGSTNSSTVWTYDGTKVKYLQPLHLQYVAVSTNRPAGTLGTQYTPDGSTAIGDRLLGTGLAGTWPVDNGTGGFQGNLDDAWLTPISNAEITVRATGNTSVGIDQAPIETARPTNTAQWLNGDGFQQNPVTVAQAQPLDPYQPWVMRAQGPLDPDQNYITYVQMPVSQAFAVNSGTGLYMTAGDSLTIRLSEDQAFNCYPDPTCGPGSSMGPSAMLSSTDVQLTGSLIASVLGTNNSTPVALGPFRVGDTSTSDQAKNAVATNVKDSPDGQGVTTLYNVTFNEATTGTAGRGSFSRVGPEAGGNLTEGASATSGYTYQATALGTNTGTATVGAITGVNADGSAYTGDTSNTSQDITFTAEGVSPEFKVTIGASTTGVTTIDFGSVLIKKTDLNPTKTLTVNMVNSFTGSGSDNVNLTGLTVDGTSKSGDHAGDYSGAPVDSTVPINANNGSRSFSLVFAPTTAGTKGNTIMSFDTDVERALGDTSNRVDINLTGEAYVATLQNQSSDPLNLGYARVGGAATAAQSVQVTNATGGGYALTNVQFLPASSVSPNGAQFNGGNDTVATLANGATAGTTYSAQALATMGPSKTARAMNGTVTIDSTEATSVQRNLTATAVSPVFNFSGANVNFEDTGAACNTVGPSGNAVCGVVNLGTLQLGNTVRTLTIANLFDAAGLDLAQLGNLADLTLMNVGFGPGFAQSDTSGSGTFSLLDVLSNRNLDPQNSGGTDLTTGRIQFTSTAAGTGFVTTLRLLTNVNSTLNVAGLEYRFDITAAWSDVPAPGVVPLVGAGLAALGLARRRRLAA